MFFVKKNLLFLLSVIMCTLSMSAMRLKHLPAGEPAVKDTSTKDVANEAFHAAEAWNQELLGKQNPDKDQEALARANLESCKKWHAETQCARCIENQAQRAQSAAAHALLEQNFIDVPLLRQIYESASVTIQVGLADGALVPRYSIRFCSKFEEKYVAETLVADSIVELQCGTATLTYYSGDYLHSFYKVEAGKFDFRIFLKIDESTKTITIHFAGPKSQAPEKVSDKKNTVFMEKHADCTR